MPGQLITKILHSMVWPDRPHYFVDPKQDIKNSLISQRIGLPAAQIGASIYTPFRVSYDDVHKRIYIDTQLVDLKDLSPKNYSAKAKVFPAIHEACRLAEFFCLPADLRQTMPSVQYTFFCLILNLLGWPLAKQPAQCTWTEVITRTLCGIPILALQLLMSIGTVWQIARLVTEFIPLLLRRYTQELTRLAWDKCQQTSGLAKIGFAILTGLCASTYIVSSIYYGATGLITYYTNKLLVQPLRFLLANIAIYSFQGLATTILTSLDCGKTYLQAKARAPTGHTLRSHVIPRPPLLSEETFSIGRLSLKRLIISRAHTAPAAVNEEREPILERTGSGNSSDASSDSNPQEVRHNPRALTL